MAFEIFQLSAPVYTELSSILAKKSVSMHYRRTEIRLLSLTRDKIEFVSDQLFSDEMPCRIIVFFVEEEARKGNLFPENIVRNFEVVE